MSALLLSTAAAKQAVDDVAQPAALQLLDQDMTVAADGTFRLVYVLEGNLTALELPESSTTTTTVATTTTTSSTTTTLPATTTSPALPSPPAPETSTPTPTTVAPPTTTTTTLPPPVDLTIDVVNYAPLDRGRLPVTALDDLVGPDRSHRSVGASVDGVRFADIRQSIEVDDQGRAILTLDVETDGNDAASVGQRLEMTEPGITPIRVELRVGDDVVATHGTVIDRLADSNDDIRPAAPIDLAVAAIVPRPDVEADDPAAIIDGMPSEAAIEQILRETRRSFAALATLVASVDVPVLAEIAPVVLGTHLMARDDRDDLRAAFADDELVAVAAGSLDVSSAVAVGLEAAVTRQLAVGEDELIGWLPLTPTRRDVWIATDPISADGAQLLRDLGFRSIVMTPELASTLVADNASAGEVATDRFVEVPLPDGTTIDVIVIDPLSRSLTTLATDEILGETTAIEWAVRTAATMLLDQRRDDPTIQRSRVLSTPDLTAPDPRLVEALARVAADTPTLRFTRATALAGVTDTTSELNWAFPAVAGTDLTARIARIDGAELALASVASMLSPDDARHTEWTDTLTSLRSTAVRDQTADATIEALLAEAEDLVGAVGTPDPFRFTLTGRSGNIPIRLTNSSDEPLDVVLRFASPKFEFPDGEQRVTLRPNDETDVPVRVTARSNGTSSVTLEVVTPLGGAIGEPVTLTSRVNALTGLGQLLTGGFILMLLAWWFNNWRGRRRADVDGEHGAEIDVAEHTTNPAQ